MGFNPMDVLKDVGNFAMDYGGFKIGQVASDASARDARDRELYMSNTAMQRRVADLKLAGLNPMLAYSSGGASAGGVASSGGYGSPQFGATAARTSGAEFSSARALETLSGAPYWARTKAAQASLAELGVEQAKATIAKLEAESEKIHAETGLVTAQQALARLDATFKALEVKEKDLSLPWIVDRIKFEAQYKQAFAEAGQLALQWLNAIDRHDDAVRNAAEKAMGMVPDFLKLAGQRLGQGAADGKEFLQGLMDTVKGHGKSLLEKGKDWWSKVGGVQ